MSLQQSLAELKTLRGNYQRAVEEKESIASQLLHLESVNNELEESQSALSCCLCEKDKELRKTRQVLGELEQRCEEQSRTISRNQQLVGEVLELAGKMDPSPATLGSSRMIEGVETPLKDDEFEKLTRIKKLLTSAEYKVRRLVEISQERDGKMEREKNKELTENERLNGELNKYKAEISKLKKDFEELTFSHNFLKMEHE